MLESKKNLRGNHRHAVKKMVIEKKKLKEMRKKCTKRRANTGKNLDETTAIPMTGKRKTHHKELSNKPSIEQQSG